MLLFSLAATVLAVHRAPWYAALGFWQRVGAALLVFLAAFVALWLLLGLLLVVLAAIAGPVGTRRDYSPFYAGVVAYIFGLVLSLCSVRVRFVGSEKLPEGRFLLVCNHRSNFDPIVTGWLLRGRRLAFVTKPSIMENFVFGRLVNRACYLGIDRENDRAALRTILDAARLIREGTVSIAIYPEGTRRAGNEMLPFRNGAFKIAQKAKAPIVVAAIRGTDEIHKRFFWRKTEVCLNICAVLDAETVCARNTGEIGEQVRTCINSALS